MKFKSFTLIEVLIVLSIFSIFFVIALSITTVLVRNMKFQQKKLLATHYAEELKEWLIFEKSQDWDFFKQKTGTYCFNNQEITWPANATPCINYGLNSFKRQAVLIFNAASNRMQITIEVSWLDIANNEKKVIINLNLSPWES